MKRPTTKLKRSIKKIDRTHPWEPLAADPRTQTKGRKAVQPAGRGKPDACASKPYFVQFLIEDLRFETRWCPLFIEVTACWGDVSPTGHTPSAALHLTRIETLGEKMTALISSRRTVQPTSLRSNKDLVRSYPLEKDLYHHDDTHPAY